MTILRPGVMSKTTSYDPTVHDYINAKGHYQHRMKCDVRMLKPPLLTESNVRQTFTKELKQNALLLNSHVKGVLCNCLSHKTL